MREVSSLIYQCKGWGTLIPYVSGQPVIPRANLHLRQNRGIDFNPPPSCPRTSLMVKNPWIPGRRSSPGFVEKWPFWLGGNRHKLRKLKKPIHICLAIWDPKGEMTSAQKKNGMIVVVIIASYLLPQVSLRFQTKLNILTLDCHSFVAMHRWLA